VTARLRRMVPGDLPAVLDLEHELFPEDAWTREMFATELSGRAPGRYYLVAEEDGQIAGYAGLLAPEPGRGRPEPGGQADVLTMAVAACRWGRGIGSALLRALLAEAARRGCAEVYLEVRVDNPRAQQLYRRHGFVDAGLRRGYYQPSGTDALVMRRQAAAGDSAPAGGAAEGRAAAGGAAEGRAAAGGAAEGRAPAGGAAEDPAGPGSAAEGSARRGGAAAAPWRRMPERRP
jgi:[ribosomal protein S18]-alanine N-acetyltransferase